jgi:hypothetical protein
MVLSDGTMNRRSIIRREDSSPSAAWDAAVQTTIRIPRADTPRRSEP